MLGSRVALMGSEKASVPSEDAAEMRPCNPKVLHHGRVIVLPPGSALSANGSILPSIGRPRNGNMFVRSCTVRVCLLLSEGEFYSLFTSLNLPCLVTVFCFL